MKQWGNPRSGTTWLNRLLRFNTDAEKVLVNETGYKHGTFVEPGWEEHAHVHSIKNPHAWLVSMLRYMHMGKGPRDPGKDVVNRRWLNRLANEYATNNTDWDALFNDHAYVLVRYEDLLRDTRKELERVCEVLGLSLTEDELRLEPRGKAPEGLTYHKTREATDRKNRDYYLGKQYFQDLPKKHFLDFSKSLSGQYHCPYLETLGYDIVNPWLAGRDELPWTN